MNTDSFQKQASRKLPRVVLGVIVILVAAGFVYAFSPRAIPVDIATIEKGPMQVNIREDGMTRIKERFVVASPLAGRLRRIELDPGDSVIAGETLLVTIEPVDPALLDARATAQAEARREAAAARYMQTEPEVEKARAEMDQAEIELGRAQQLSERDAITERELDEVRLLMRQAQQLYRAAVFSREVAQFELKLAEAALLQTQGDDGESNGQAQLPIISPITGRVLRVFQESSKVVAPGEDLIEIGNPEDLEVVVDVLSRDAVRVSARMTQDQTVPPRVQLEHWGGPHPLNGVVRTVEPSGFTKISVLGVEEQRVNIVIDFDEPPERHIALGDGFRVEASIVIWEEDDAVICPTSALFRDAGEWAVFRSENGRAALRTVQIGERNGLQAQVLDGLKPGDLVIAHPGDQVVDGTRVSARD